MDREYSNVINDRLLGMLHYRAWGRPDLEPVLFLHGFMGSSEDWRPIAGELAGDRYCVALDLPGHGGSVLRDDQSWDMSLAARMVHRAQQALDLAAPDVVGYSMGGRIALYLAAFHGEMLRRAVIEGASPGLEDLSERQRRRQQDETLASELEKGGLEAFLERWYAQPLFASLQKRPELLKAAIARRMHGSPSNWAKSLRDMGLGMQPCLWQHLRRVEAAALVVTGSEDPKFDAIGDRMAELLPRARREVIEGAGHNAHLESPGEFVEALRRFLEAGSGQ